MSEYQLIELIGLAALAGYLIYRLYLVLGQSGDDSPHRTSEKKAKGNNVVPLKTTTKMREAIRVKTRGMTSSEPYADPLFKEIQKTYPEFNPEDFQKGGENAFVLIVESFSKGDLDTIKAYISPEVHRIFLQALQKRQSKGEVHHVQVVKISLFKIVSVQIVKNTLALTVTIESEQAITIKDAQGQDLYPDQEDLDRVSDQWVFSRPLGSKNPNWTLEAIQPLADEKVTQ